MTDYAARQGALHANREAEGYNTPEQVAKRDQQRADAAAYNDRIGATRLTRRARALSWCDGSRGR